MAKKIDMDAVMEFIRETLEATKDSNGDIHLTCCQVVAEQFNLWEPMDNGGEGFPIWLSRIIAGEMNDMGIKH